MAAMVYAPSKVSTTLPSGAKVEIMEQTNYPFEEQIAFTVSLPERKHRSAEFPFDLRIPEWSNGYTLTINGEEVKAADVRNGTIRIARTWNDGDKVILTLNATVRTTRWYDSAAVIERGPLVYALRMEEKWEKHICEGADKQKYGDYYYEVTSPSRWNVALRGGDLKAENIATKFVVEKGECSDKPWSLESAPIKIKAEAHVLPTWVMEHNSAGDFGYYSQQPPKGEVGEVVNIELIPYGCTTLRIAEFPVR